MSGVSGASHFIDSVMFGVLSSSDILQMSVLDINEQSLRKFGVAKSNGINDVRLGSTSRDILCSTCGQNHTYCPGHYGHITLALPIINTTFCKDLYKFLHCVCYYCSSRLFCKKTLHYVDLYQIIKARKIVHCENTHCKKRQPTWSHSAGLISPHIDLDSLSVQDIQDHRMGLVCNPFTLMHMLRSVSHDDITTLGLDPLNAHPADMIWTLLPVPPSTIRPSLSAISNNKVNGEDKLTMQLRNIVKVNNLLLKELQNLSDEATIDLGQYTYQGESYTSIDDILHAWSDLTPTLPVNPTSNVVSKLYSTLHLNIASYQDVKYNNKGVSHRFLFTKSGQNGMSLVQRFTGINGRNKMGRFRGTLFGKQQNMCARAVITPDPDLSIEEVGVPQRICMKLTYPTMVTGLNIRSMVRIVHRGPFVYPGANGVERPDGVYINLSTVHNANVHIDIGWKVHRHLVSGDIVLFNRQPSLHKYSMLAHRVRVIGEHTLRLTLPVTTAYNADFDGDEMNILPVQSVQAKAEAEELMLVGQNLIKHNNMLVAFHQHSVLAAFVLSKAHTEVSIDVVRDMMSASLCKCKDMGSTLLTLSDNLQAYGPVETLCGREVFSLWLPRDFNCVSNSTTIIQDGQVRTNINKLTLNHHILRSYHERYGNGRTVEFIDVVQAMLDEYIRCCGSTFHTGDCRYHVPIPHYKDTVLAAMSNYVDTYPSHVQSNHDRSSNEIEDNICIVLDKARDLVGQFVMDHHTSALNDNMFDIVLSGSKGNVTNIVQNLAMVGQQRMNMRYRMTPTNHSFHSTSTDQYGMVYNSFCNGLSPLQYFFHLSASREGLIDTAVSTSDTGYLQRKVSKFCEDLVATTCGIVRNERQQIVQFKYGYDAMDVCRVYPVRIQLFATRQQLLMAYGDRDCKQDTEYIQQLWTLSQKCTQYAAIGFKSYNTIMSPIQLQDYILGLTTSEKSNVIHKTICHQILSTFISTLQTDYRLTPAVQYYLQWYLNPNYIRLKYRWDISTFISALQHVRVTVSQSQVAPDERVGIQAAQTIIAPWTQLNLNRFHFSGGASKLVFGVPRIKEIINVTAKPKLTTMTLFVKHRYNVDVVGARLVEVPLHRIIHAAVISEDRIYIVFKKKICTEHHITMTHITHTLHNTTMLTTAQLRCDMLGSGSSTVFDTTWWVYLPWSTIKRHLQDTTPQSSDTSGKNTNKQVKQFLQLLCTTDSRVTLVSGVHGIQDFYVSHTECLQNDTVTTEKCIITAGANVELLKKYHIGDQYGIDIYKSYTNSVVDMWTMFGIDMAKTAINIEFNVVLGCNNIHIASRHISLVADAMTRTGEVIPISNTGLVKDGSSVFKMASFEKSLPNITQGCLSSTTTKYMSFSDTMVLSNVYKHVTSSIDLIPCELPVSRATLVRHTNRMLTNLPFPYVRTEIQRKLLLMPNVPVYNSMVSMTRKKHASRRHRSTVATTPSADVPDTYNSPVLPNMYTLHPQSTLTQAQISIGPIKRKHNVIYNTGDRHAPSLTVRKRNVRPKFVSIGSSATTPDTTTGPLTVVPTRRYTPSRTSRFTPTSPSTYGYVTGVI